MDFCNNCDTEKRTHICTTCLLGLCDECALLHPKVKATRGHVVELQVVEVDLEPLSNRDILGHTVQNENSQMRSNNAKIAISSTVDKVGCSSITDIGCKSSSSNNELANEAEVCAEDEISNTSFFKIGNQIINRLADVGLTSKKADFKTIAFSLGASLAMHLACKMIFGRFSSITYIVVGVCLYTFFAKMQKKYRKGVENIAKVSLDLKKSIRQIEKIDKQSILHDKEFDTEFWHKRNGTTAKLRQRGVRKYDNDFHCSRKSLKSTKDNDENLLESG